MILVFLRVKILVNFKLQRSKGIEIMQFIINTVISFIYALIIAIISSIENQGVNTEILHFALFDFLIVQIFLLVIEMYRDRSSKEVNFLKEQKYKKFINGLMEFEEKEDVDQVREKLVSFSLEKCLEYCKLEQNQDIQVSVVIMNEIKEMLVTLTKERKCFYKIEHFQMSDLEKYDSIIIFYNSYSELYKLNQIYGKQLINEKLSFYRKHEEIEFKSYYVFDEQYAIVEEIEENYVIYSRHDIVLNYIKDFVANEKKSVPFGRTQGQDSLFRNQAIKEFYGDGNIPNIHLDKIINGIGRKILDLGTGAGRLLSYFTDESKFEVVAMDKDETALNVCKKNYSAYTNINFLWEEFDENSFQVNQFDVVIAFNSLYHTDRASILNVISRVKQILKPGGYFLLTLKTLDGNEKVYRHAGELYPEKPENTFINTEFPDYYLPHHFCDNEEIDMYLNKFSNVVYKEEIPYEEHNGVIVQGRGFFFILQK